MPAACHRRDQAARLGRCWLCSLLAGGDHVVRRAVQRPGRHGFGPGHALRWRRAGEAEPGGRRGRRDQRAVRNGGSAEGEQPSGRKPQDAVGSIPADRLYPKVGKTSSSASNASAPCPWFGRMDGLDANPRPSSIGCRQRERLSAARPRAGPDTRAAPSQIACDR